MEITFPLAILLTAAIGGYVFGGGHARNEIIQSCEVHGAFYHGSSKTRFTCSVDSVDGRKPPETPKGLFP